MKKLSKRSCKWLLLLGMIVTAKTSMAQTEFDALMMAKNNFCSGPMYSSGSWNQYWEGTYKRTNENLGTVSTQMVGYMGNYGITSKLNVLFGLPYVKTKASAGTLAGQKGLQDLSLWVKYMPLEIEVGKGTLSVYGIGGLSFPVSNYTPDFLPLSIGLGSTNLSLRAMVDYQLGKWSTTVSGTYIARSNITIDRDAYYTTEMHNTNEVQMPNATSYNIRSGYRSDRLIIEGVFNNWTTQGGFDITKNNMPFPSNRMIMSSVGYWLKYNVKAVNGLALVTGGDFVVAGRNVGQSKTFSGGIFYIIDFSKKKTKKEGNSTSPTK
jgi:hypothetical protein